MKQVRKNEEYAAKVDESLVHVLLLRRGEESDDSLESNKLENIKMMMRMINVYASRLLLYHVGWSKSSINKSANYGSQNKHLHQGWR